MQRFQEEEHSQCDIPFVPLWWAASPRSRSVPDDAHGVRPRLPFAALDAEIQRATTALLWQAELLARAPGWMVPGDALTPAALPAGSGVCVCRA